MSICVASAVAAINLAGSAFMLSWTHSVERVEWQEQWRVSGAQLQLESARVKGSGAGMEPPPDATWRDGWWSYPSHLPPQREVWLAVSGATVDGWRLCPVGGGCVEIEKLAAGGQPIDRLRLSAGPRCEPLEPSPSPSR
ncbi:MAG: DUF1850 domain-containing protein [Burkholderiaceae bacterium]